MYAVYNEDHDIIAYHDDFKICKEYANNIYHCHGYICDIKKIKKRDRYILDKLYDLYLVRFADTYVQQGYLVYLELAGSQELYDIKYSKDVLYKLLEAPGLSDKKLNHIKKTINILEDIYEEEKIYTPTLNHLKELKLGYDPYLYNNGINYYL